MGLIVNQGTSLVYISTGSHDSGDNLQVLNSLLENLYSSERIGNPTGITTGASYNPLSFNILSIPDCNYPGDEITAELIYFNTLGQTSVGKSFAVRIIFSRKFQVKTMFAKMLHIYTQPNIRNITIITGNRISDISPMGRAPTRCMLNGRDPTRENCTLMLG